MMTSVMSSFDPTNYSYDSSALNFIMAIISIYLVMKKFNMLNSKMITSKVVVLNEMTASIKEVMKDCKKKSNLMAILIVLSMIITSNLLSNNPYFHANNAQPKNTIYMALMVWSSIMLFFFINEFKSSMAHFTPMMSPKPIMNFMVMVEFVSIMMRPITLMVRLTANIMAGHLLISLISMLNEYAPISMVATTPFTLALSILELMVSIIQAYVFSLLTAIYYMELSSSH